jgi:hypothetical protein
MRVEITSNARRWLMLLAMATLGFSASGCTVKAVGDPKRPITIQHHITIDIRGLEKTAYSIEDYVSGEDS